jgi:hypothetical protein
MSYTPPNQYLCPSIQKINEGVAEFTRAANERLCDPAEWRADHLDELGEIVSRLWLIRSRLGKLASETE